MNGKPQLSSAHAHYIDPISIITLLHCSPLKNKICPRLHQQYYTMWYILHKSIMGRGVLIDEGIGDVLVVEIKLHCCPHACKQL